MEIIVIFKKQREYSIVVKPFFNFGCFIIIESFYFFLVKSSIPSVPR